MYELYGDFAFHNPAFVDLTEQRAVSYWNCYMRSRYPDLRDHPTRIFAKALRQAGRDYGQKSVAKPYGPHLSHAVEGGVAAAP
jgi:hypothetical protein